MCFQLVTCRRGDRSNELSCTPGESLAAMGKATAAARYASAIVYRHWSALYDSRLAVAKQGLIGLRFVTGPYSPALHLLSTLSSCGRLLARKTDKSALPAIGCFVV